MAMSCLRPITVAYILSFAGVLVSLTSATPVPDVVDEWNSNNVHTVEIGDEHYELSTRDIVLIGIAAVILFFILICLVGYCLCECIRSLICCICCCE